MNRTDVQGTLREMWETRPARPRQDRQVGGVATAIARRYDIDPVLVRVGFAVAALTGIGGLLYLLGWIVLPEEPPDPADPIPARRPQAMVLALGVSVIGGLVTVFSGGLGYLFPTAAVAALLYLLHRGRGDRVLHLGVPIGAAGSRAGGMAPPAAGPSMTGSSTTGSATAGPSLVKDPAGAVTTQIPLGTPVAEPEAERTPPSWDPLGAAPFAWDLPEPSPLIPTGPAERKLPVTAVTLGLALLAGGATALLLLILGALTLENLRVVLGVGLSVLGLGLVAGAFVRAGRGLIPLAIIGSMLTWGVLAAPLDRWPGDNGIDGFGELRVAPTNVAALEPSYDLGAGEIVLDLRELDLSVPPAGDGSAVPVAVSVGAGEIQVRLPADADVRLNASAGLGEVSFGGRQEGGPDAAIVVPQDLGADGVRAGRLLLLELDAGLGEVQVRRG